MDHEPKTLFVAGVIKGIGEHDADSKTVVVSSDANDVKFRVRTSDRLYQKIKVGRRYLIVYKENNPCKIIALWNNPSAKKIVTTAEEIRKFGTIVQKEGVRKV